MISEGLRVSIGVTTRLPRVAPDEVLRYKEWEIPIGVSHLVPPPNLSDSRIEISRTIDTCQRNKLLRPDELHHLPYTRSLPS